MVNGRYPIVLTADHPLLADYPVLFDGIMGTIQPIPVPEPIMRHISAPPFGSDHLAARKAPRGLRRIEAALLSDPRAIYPVNLVAIWDQDQDEPWLMSDKTCCPWRHNFSK